MIRRQEKTTSWQLFSIEIWGFILDVQIIIHMCRCYLAVGSKLANYSVIYYLDR